MGLMDFIKGQLIDVISCLDSSENTIIWRFPMGKKDIMMGAKLIVRESQVAIFVNEGQIADVFSPGTYTLSTQNMPVMTTLKSWKYGFQSPFKAEVYYVNMRQFTEQKWGTPSPIAVSDPEFNVRILLQCRGQFSFRVADSVKFMQEYSGTMDVCTADHVIGHLRGFIVQYLKDCIMESKLGYTELNSNLIEFSDKVSDSLQPKFRDLGLSLVTFTITEIDMPENLKNAISKGAEINLMGGLHTVQTLSTLDALKTAAANEGNPMTGMGAGMVMTNMMGQMFGQMQQQNAQAQYQQPVQNAAPKGVPCSQCGSEVLPGAKFCNNCGASTSPPKAKCISCGHEIPASTKFCPECGASQAIPKCSKCGTEIPGNSKFCPECGTPR